MATTSPAPTRPRRRLRPVEVATVERLSPRLVSVGFTGQFDGFELSHPTHHIKVLIPSDHGRDVELPAIGPDGPIWPADQPRPPVRTYTPRRFDPDTGLLEVQFVMHGEGPASNWAERAQVGDRLAIGGPGGRFSLELDAGPWLIGGDESAVPAIGSLLEYLPSQATGQVFIETDGGAPIVDLQTPVQVRVEWLTATHGALGDRLREALNATPVTAETSVWVACEASAVRQIRSNLLGAGTVQPSRLTTRGYWRLGQADHPDHDYGEG